MDALEGTAFCAHCDWNFCYQIGLDSQLVAATKLAEHARICPANPLVRRVQELEREEERAARWQREAVKRDLIITDLEAKVEELERMLAALRAHPDLRAWVQHKEDCRLFEGWIDVGDNDPFFQHKRGKNCTCGLDAALRSLNEGRQAQTEASAAPQEEP